MDVVELTSAKRDSRRSIKSQHQHRQSTNPIQGQSEAIQGEARAKAEKGGEESSA